MLEIFLEEENRWEDEKVLILSRKLPMVVHIFNLSSWEREAEAL